MIGQWLGRISGTNAGYASASIDADRPHVALLQVDAPPLPFAAIVALTISGSRVSGELREVFLTEPVPEGARPPAAGRISGNLSGLVFEGEWETDVDTRGKCVLHSAQPDVVGPPEETFSWAAFRSWVLANQTAHTGWIYRGQRQNSWPLLTTFHRTGRSNLYRYDQEDVPRLHRALEAATGTRYTPTDPYDYGALLNLGQHHGFPTPLLDWTESPFIAAFFAFSSVPKAQAASAPPVRIFCFACNKWPSRSAATITAVRPCLSPLSLGARGNPRALPQQSVHLFSNIVDIEGYIRLTESAMGSRFLTRVDIPASERAVAMRDLAEMGITSAALFPGIQGVCEALTERWF